jgi:hypothetical protein
VQCHAEPHRHAADELGPGGGGVDDPAGREYSGHAVHAHFAGCGVDAGLDELGAE